MKTYTPRPDSVPARLITLLQAHPGGVLNSIEAAQALDIESKNLPALLSRAIEAGLIVRGRDDAGVNTFGLPWAGTPTPAAPGADGALEIYLYPDGDISFTGAGVSEAGEVLLTPAQQRQLVRRLCLPLIPLEGL